MKKEAETILKYEDRTLEIQRMWIVKTKVIPLMTVLKEPSQNNSENTCATYRESTKKGYYRNSHIGHRTHASGISDVKRKTSNFGNNSTCTMNCYSRIVATLNT